MRTPSHRAKPLSGTPSLTLLLWQETLLSWGIPAFLVVCMVVVILLATFTGLPTVEGIILLGWFLLLLVAFYPLRTAVQTAAGSRRKLMVLAFGVAWIAVMASHFYFAASVGPQLMTGSVAPDGPGLLLPLEGPKYAYDLVVQGTFVAGSEGVAREASYDLSLEKGGEKVRDLEGTFSEQWYRRRSRRGGTTTHELRNREAHLLRNLPEGSYRIRVARLDSLLEPRLTVTLFRDLYPERTFWLLSALLLIGACVIEAMARQSAFVTATAMAVIFVVVLRALSAPPHGYSDLFGALVVAALAGPAAGWVVKRIAGRVSRLSRRSP